MQVADCYIHVRYRRLGEQEFENLQERLLGVATELARNVSRARDADYTFEEGTLLQRILIIGRIGLSVVAAAAMYHDLRDSVIEMASDAENLSSLAIDQFHRLTHTTAADEIYRRTTSRDLNRLQRIVSNFDEISEGHVSASGLASIRGRVIHDLARLRGLGLFFGGARCCSTG